MVIIIPRHDLMLTTARQGEQGRGRRHVPGLRPPNHVGPQPPVRILVRGIHPSPSLVPDPQIHRHPGDLVVGRGCSVAVAVGGDHVPRGADAGGLADLPSSWATCRSARRVAWRMDCSVMPRGGAMRATIAEPSASTGNTARSRREPCPWRPGSPVMAQCKLGGSRWGATARFRGVATKILHYPTRIR